MVISRNTNRLRGSAFFALALALATGLTGCASTGFDLPREPQPGSTASQQNPDAPAAEPSITFSAVTDGDTIVTSVGTVRIIGIDAPERDQCGHVAASQAISDLLTPGDHIILDLPSGQNDRDRYDRLLRYVLTTDGVDIGLMQIELGNAVAKYDSTDGYPAHPHESAYHAAQIAQIGARGDVVSPICQVEAAEAAASAAAASPTPTIPPPAGAGPENGSWFSRYPSCAALKRNSVGDPSGPFNRDDPSQVEIYNWFQYGTGHRGDGDGDGLACE